MKKSPKKAIFGQAEKCSYILEPSFSAIILFRIIKIYQKKRTQTHTQTDTHTINLGLKMIVQTVNKLFGMKILS